MYVNFTKPLFLYFLFIIPVIIFFHFYSLKHIRNRALKFANYEAIARVKGIDLYSKNIVLMFIDISILITLVFTLSGLTLYTEMDSSQFSYVIAIDNSQSMGATDIYPDRITAAKESAKDFINSLPINTKIAVMTFSGNSYVRQEMTDNKQTLKNAIDNIEITDIGGTDIYEAVTTSYFLLKSEENRALILLSDGQINSGNIVDASEYARSKQMIIHSVAIGTKEGGATQFGISKLDEESLMSLAYTTNGRYFNANSPDELEKGFKEIAPLTRRIGDIDLTFALIIITILLFMLKQFLVQITGISI